MRGETEILQTSGEFDSDMFHIRPKRIISIGIEGQGPSGLNARCVE